MKFQIPNSKKTFIHAVLLLITIATQAQNFEDPIKPNIPEEITNNTVKSPENIVTDPNAIAIAMEKAFYKNAKLAGLTDEKTQELIKIINERNQVLKDLDTRKKQANAAFSIQDPLTLYNLKIKEARNEYTRKISSMITYNQYCYFIVDDYREEVKEKSDLEYLQLSKNNPHLTKDQKLKLHKLIYNYYLNKTLTAVYFSFDTNIQKPKLGFLRFNFEKEFAAISKEYNIKIGESKQSNSNNFQWN